jgi:transposase InsO family protein
VDLTVVTGPADTPLPVLAMVDYGSRRCLALQPVADKRSLTLLLCLLKTVRVYGKPRAIKTDNEAVFTSRLFKTGLALLNIRHQLSDIASPWQNGRVERLIGTLKDKIGQLTIADPAQLAARLPEFVFWYNAVRPHQHLDGKTPLEAWHNVDVFNETPKRVYRFDAWDGLLTGYYLLT